MKISPIAYKVKYNKPINFKNNYSQSSNKANAINFMGKQYPSGYYTDEQIKYAKKYLGQKNWEEEYHDKRLDELMEHFNQSFEECMDVDGEHWAKARLCVLFWPVTLPVALVNGTIKQNKAEDKISKEIKQISALMVDLNNEKLEEAKKKQAEIKKQQEAEKRKGKIQNSINANFLQSLNGSKDDDSANVPTVVMIYGSTEQEREDILCWIQRQIDARVKTFSLTDSEDDNLYRIETEIDYAQDFYHRNRTRSVLFINNFDSMLNSDTVSFQTIGDMKELLSDINKDKSPVTIIFQTNDINRLNNAFISNKTRIPYMLDLDSVK